MMNLLRRQEQMTIKFLDLQACNALIADEIKAACNRVIDSGWYILGEECQKFEFQYAQYNGVKHCVGVGNGLDALRIALMAMDIGVGDEVIVPSHTYIATWLAVSQVGATIVPVECNPNSFNIEPENILDKITKKTKIILPVNLYGQCCDMDKIMAIAKKYNIRVLVDGAQSQGVKYNNTIRGALGDITATSFYSGKNLGALGDGGAILTDNDEIAQKSRIIANYGAIKKYENLTKGINSRLDEIQAAILRVKLNYLETWNNHRKIIADFYIKNINNPHIITPKNNNDSVWHLFVIRTPYRDKLMEFLSKKSIQTLIHYPIPVHQQPAYREFSNFELPIAKNLANQVLSLPIAPNLTLEQARLVADACNEFYP